jgi:hypothetical protein
VSAPVAVDPTTQADVDAIIKDYQRQFRGLVHGASPAAPEPTEEEISARVQKLMKDSESLRMVGDEWERFWLMDQPSRMTPVPTRE